MRKPVLVALCLVGVQTQALTYHRSFRSVGFSSGGAASVSVPYDARAAKAIADAQAEEANRPRVIIGRVTRVLNGITFNVVTGGDRKFVVRLKDVDASAAKSPRALALLKKSVVGRNVRVEFRSQDQSGCLLGEVTVGERDINEAARKAAEGEYE